MHAKSIGLIWIVVKDFKKAIEFYTKFAGLELMEMNEEYGWAELQGYEGGTRLGIAKQKNDGEDPIEPGQNAVMTITVEDLDLSVNNLKNAGGSIVGQPEVIPGHVKLQSAKDSEGNLFQFVEILASQSCSTGCGCH